MFLRKHGLFTVVMLVMIWGLNFDVRSDIDAETTADPFIAKAEKLISTEKYYEAILALEPLLMSNEKSEAQEEALWLAHQLAKKYEPVIQNGYWHSKTEAETEFWQKAKAENTRRLDVLVGGNFWAGAMYYFGYDYGFLQRLIDEYPDTPKRPSAEYYLIRKGKVVLGYDAGTIQAYHAYIEKYEKTGRAEVYMAYRDLAHIHHGIWAALTFPDKSDAGMWDGFGYEGYYSSEDPEKEKATAAAHKAKAEKYYLRYHLNPFGLPEEDSFQRLKNNEAFGWQFILYGC